MNIFFQSMLVFGSLALFSTGAFAVEPAGHGGSMIQEEKMQNETMHGMASKDMQHSVNYEDRSFLSAMIPHHEAAVVMANDVLEKGKDSQVKKWAHEVIAAQQAEIVQMSGWLKNLGGEDKNAAKAMNDSMHAMMTSSMDKDADRNFVVMMIDHHASALEMATRALINSEDDKIVSLANQIITAQSKEIMEYKQWLKKNLK